MASIFRKLYGGRRKKTQPTGDGVSTKSSTESSQASELEPPNKARRKPQQEQLLDDDDDDLDVSISMKPSVEWRIPAMLVARSDVTKTEHVSDEMPVQDQLMKAFGPVRYFP